jgi:predicted nucleic acid-binding protein
MNNNTKPRKVTLRPTQTNKVLKVAKERYESNFSMALRVMVDKFKIVDDEAYANKLKNSMTGNYEADHGTAENVLLEALKELGCEKLADEFEKQTINFWYS